MHALQQQCYWILYYTCNYIIMQMTIICTLIAVQWLILSTEILRSYLVLVFFAYNKPSKCSLYVCRKGGAMWLQSHLIFHSYRLIMYVQYTNTTLVIAVQHYMTLYHYNTVRVWCDYIVTLCHYAIYVYSYCNVANVVAMCN